MSGRLSDSILHLGQAGHCPGIMRAQTWRVHQARNTCVASARLADSCDAGRIWGTLRLVRFGRDDGKDLGRGQTPAMVARIWAKMMARIWQGFGLVVSLT